MLARYHRRDRESGFSIVELMVVIGIIAILSSIAVMGFLNQRKAAWSAAAKQDASNASIYIAQNQSFLNGHKDYAENALPGFTTSPQVKMKVYGPATHGRTTSCIETYHDSDTSDGKIDTKWHIYIDERQLTKGGCLSA